MLTKNTGLQWHPLVVIKKIVQHYLPQQQWLLASHECDIL